MQVVSWPRWWCSKSSFRRLRSSPDKPSRLGWQMYSGLGEEPVRVTGARGQPVEIPWSEILPKPRRPEIDWTNRLPEYLCTILDEPLITVTVGHRSRTVSC